MQDTHYLLIRKLIEELEEDNQTGKIILFFDEGELKAVELDKKIKVRVE